MAERGDDLTHLALAARDGDRDALASFVARSQGEIWRFCANAGSRADADDLTQEVYLRAIPALARFEARSSARTWLFSIAHRVCADALRRRRRRWPLGDGRSPDPDRVDVEGDRAGAVDLWDRVRSLDADKRAAFTLTQALGFSYAEAAEVCACPVGTIRSRVARAREELLHELGLAEEA
jgi:RNA polymerase sigma-70 factor (ECF subfamily)